MDQVLRTLGGRDSSSGRRTSPEYPVPGFNVRM